MPAKMKIPVPSNLPMYHRRHYRGGYEDGLRGRPASPPDDTGRLERAAYEWGWRDGRAAFERQSTAGTWIAYRQREGEVELIGLYTTREAAKDSVAREYGLSWNDPGLSDRSTWYTGGWTYEVREAVEGPPVSVHWALTLRQPWATLVAIGAKKIETCSWATEYRGPLAIHAAREFPPEAQALCAAPPFKTALVRAGYNQWEKLPRGVVVATCLLARCEPIEAAIIEQLVPEAERPLGDYTPGQYAWILEDVRPVIPPIPARGGQGLWAWDPVWDPRSPAERRGEPP